MWRNILLWKTLLVLVVILVCVVNFTPVKEKVKLGLDLKGGSYLVLRVLSDDAIRAEADKILIDLETRMAEEEIPFEKIIRTDEGNVSISGVDLSKEEALFDLIREELSDEWERPPVVRRQGPTATFVLSMREGAKNKLRDAAFTKALETIRRRIDV